MLGRAASRLGRATKVPTATIGAAHAPSLSATPTWTWSFSCRYHDYGASRPAPPKFGSADWHSTTILSVRKDGRVCMIGDGMVSMGSVTVKPNARKIRRIEPKRSGPGGGWGRSESGGSDKTKEGQAGQDEEEEEEESDSSVLVGFAGATADAFTLVERLEGKIDEYPGQLARSCVELAKGWRTDKYLRRLEASILVADSSISLEITGNGDVLESHDGVMGVGSGAFYAIAAARALIDVPDMTAEQVARKAMGVAADMCIYTNHNFIVETVRDDLGGDKEKKEGKEDGEKKEEDKEL